MEIARLWQTEVEEVPIIIGALIIIPDDLKRNLERLVA